MRAPSPPVPQNTGSAPIECQLWAKKGPETKIGPAQVLYPVEAGPVLGNGLRCPLEGPSEPTD